MPRLLYTLLIYLLLPFTPIKLLWRSIRQPEYRQHMAERYGCYGNKPQQPVIWLHCVSLGETRAAAPLVQSLLQAYPTHRILLTHATPTGREAGEQLFGDQVDRVYLPYDTPGAVARFLKHFKPAVGLLLETELWFNLIAGCHQRSIPVLLVNARLSARSAKGYARVAGLTRQALQQLTAIAAQTEADAARLQQLGAAAVSICGNLKFDVKPPEDAVERGLALRQLLGKHRPVFLAASTRDGEEDLILDAMQQLNDPNLLTVIVPRHPQRFDSVAELLKKRGTRFQRRSEIVSSGPEAQLDQGAAADEVRLKPTTNILLGDTMGEMFTYYAACDVAFIGGSLLPFGGQNLIEAAIMGKPVLVGPYTFNFDWVAEAAVQSGGAIRVHDVSMLAAAVQQLLMDQVKRIQTGNAALRFSQQEVGANQRLLTLVQGVLG